MKFADVESLSGEKCGLTFGKIELPDDAPEKIDEHCCFKANYLKEPLLICLTEMKMCSSTIKQIAKFIKFQCVSAPPSDKDEKGPTKRQLLEDYRDLVINLEITGLQTKELKSVIDDYCSMNGVLPN